MGVTVGLLKWHCPMQLQLGAVWPVEWKAPYPSPWSLPGAQALLPVLTDKAHTWQPPSRPHLGGGWRCTEAVPHSSPVSFPYAAAYVLCGGVALT